MVVYDHTGHPSGEPNDYEISEMAIHPQLFARRLDTSQATMPCVRSSRLLLPGEAAGRLLDARSQYALATRQGLQHGLL
jgi:hypothetical protein